MVMNFSHMFESFLSCNMKCLKRYKKDLMKTTFSYYDQIFSTIKQNISWWVAGNIDVKVVASHAIQGCVYRNQKGYKNTKSV